MILYFVDDVLNIINNNKLITIKMKDIIYQGNIIKRNLFIDEFNKAIKKEKIKSKLFGDKISIVKNGYYNNRDLYFLETLFLELGFIKVEFINIVDLLPDRDATFVEVNKDYMVMYFDKPLFIDLNIINDIPNVIKYFKDKSKSDIVLFGTNEFISGIKVFNFNIYYLENSSSYICDSLLKVKKYGV